MTVKVFAETGKFWEKYNVVSCTTGVFNPDRYPTQSGFGWTNAVFLRFVNDFNLQDVEKDEENNSGAKKWEKQSRKRK